MEMRTKVLIGAASALLVVGGVIVFLLLRSSATTPIRPGQETGSETSRGEEGNKEEKISEAEKKAQHASQVADTPEAQMKRVAMDFVARFGSFSTDAPNENLLPLLPLMGPTLRAWAEARLLAPKQVYIQYQGITTIAVSAQIVEQNNSQAIWEIGTVRLYDDAAGTRRQVETALVKVLKKSGNYLIDSVTFVVKK